MSASRILSRLRHKGQITEEEYRKLMTIKNNERHMQKVLEDIKEEIGKIVSDAVDSGDDLNWARGLNYSIPIIDKYIRGNADAK